MLWIILNLTADKIKPRHDVSIFAKVLQERDASLCREERAYLQNLQTIGTVLSFYLWDLINSFIRSRNLLDYSHDLFTATISWGTFIMEGNLAASRSQSKNVWHCSLGYEDHWQEMALGKCLNQGHPSISLTVELEDNNKLPSLGLAIVKMDARWTWRSVRNRLLCYYCTTKGMLMWSTNTHCSKRGLTAQSSFPGTDSLSIRNANALRGLCLSSLSRIPDTNHCPTIFRGESCNGECVSSTKGPLASKKFP